MNIQTKKIENIILYFANRSSKNSIERVKLMKLIWLSDRLHLNKYGRLILKDRYMALPKGSIASTTLNMSKHSFPEVYDVSGFIIKSRKDTDLNFFSKSDIKIMEYVWDKFGDKDSFELSDYSHLFPEWLRFEQELNNTSFPNSYDIVIQDFFKTPEGVDFSDLFSDDEKKMSEQDFNISSSIQNFLRT